MKILTNSFFLLFLIFLGACQAGSGDNATKNNKEALASFVDLEVSSFEAKMKDPNVVVLDVRTHEETADGMINGAIEIDYRSPDFAKEIAGLDKDKIYLIYCRSGGRSVGACNAMAEQGFDNLYNLLGGYQAWAKEH